MFVSSKLAGDIRRHTKKFKGLVESRLQSGDVNVPSESSGFTGDLVHKTAMTPLVFLGRL